MERCTYFIYSALHILCADFYSQINLKLIFSKSLSFESMQRFKDQTPVDLLSNIAYLFKCNQCEATYEGETTRHLHTLVADHKWVSFRTHKPLSPPPNSMIRDHAEETNHEIVFNDFRVLSRWKEFDTKITESVLLQQMKPSLNNHEASVSVNILR